MNTMRSRTAGRALVIDPAGRVLMIRGEDPADRGSGGFWFTPGGGLDPGESVEDGTRRELREELGLVVAALGAVVMHRVSRFPYAGELYEQTETIHLVEVAAPFDPQPVSLSALEKELIKGFRWFSADELRSLREDYYPESLASLLDHLATDGVPDPPWTEDLRSGE